MDSLSHLLSWLLKPIFSWFTHSSNSIEECQKRIDGLHIGLVGDLKYSRTIHSFAELCLLFDVRLYFVAPDGLSLPESISDTLKKQSIRFSFHQSLDEIIPKVDILYVTRIQHERFSGRDLHASFLDYTLTPESFKKAKPHLKVLHPLPRIHEIDRQVDDTPFAYYFTQAANGIYLREALLTLLLNEDAP